MQIRLYGCTLDFRNVSITITTFNKHKRAYSARNGFNAINSWTDSIHFINMSFVAYVCCVCVCVCARSFAHSRIRLYQMSPIDTYGIYQYINGILNCTDPEKQQHWQQQLRLNQYIKYVFTYGIDISVQFCLCGWPFDRLFVRARTQIIREIAIAHDFLYTLDLSTFIQCAQCVYGMRAI